MSLWCLRCAHKYPSVRGAASARRCPKCGGVVLTNREPVLSAALAAPQMRSTMPLEGTTLPQDATGSEKGIQIPSRPPEEEFC